MSKLLFATLTAALAFAASAHAQDTKIELSAVPQNIMDTAMKEVPDFKAASANTEMEDGKTVYEVQGMAGDKKVEVDVMEDGTLDEVETEVDMSAVPKAVTDAVMGKMPNFKPNKIEESKRPAGTFYEIEGMDDTNKMDVEIMADGSSMKAEAMKAGN